MLDDISCFEFDEIAVHNRPLISRDPTLFSQEHRSYHFIFFSSAIK